MNMPKRIVSVVMVVTFIFSLGPMPSAMALRPKEGAEGTGAQAVGDAIKTAAAPAAGKAAATGELTSEDIAAINAHMLDIKQSYPIMRGKEPLAVRHIFVYPDKYVTSTAWQPMEMNTYTQEGIAPPKNLADWMQLNGIKYLHLSPEFVRYQYNKSSDFVLDTPLANLNAILAMLTHQMSIHDNAFETWFTSREITGEVRVRIDSYDGRITSIEFAPYDGVVEKVAAALPAAGERVLVVGDARELQEFIASNAQKHSVRISVDVLPEATDEQMKTYDLVIKKTDVGYQLVTVGGTVTAAYSTLPEVETAIDKQMGTWA